MTASAPVLTGSRAILLAGPVTAPIAAPPSDPEHPTPDDGLAVLTWRGSVYVQPVLRVAGPAGTRVLGVDGDGCPTCLRRSILDHHVPRAARPLSQARSADVETVLAALPAAMLVAVRAVAARIEHLRSGRTAVIEPATLDVRFVDVPPRHDCPDCAADRVTRTAPASARELLRTVPGTGRPEAPLPAGLGTDYLGAHALFGAPRVDLDGPVPAAQVDLPLRSGASEAGIGRAGTVAASRRTAVLEGLERYAGLHAGAHAVPRPGPDATLDELGETALDPHLLGYHLPEDYAQTDFPFAPLRRDVTVAWSPVTALGAGTARFVPRSVLSWVTRPGPVEPFFFDTSNGFALGRTRPEAALHALLEVVERDAFLLTWYRRLVLPELTWRDEPSLRTLVRRVEFVLRVRVRLYWAALDTGLPVVVAVIFRDRDGADEPVTFLSAGAGLTAVAAARSAVVEAAAIAAATVASFDEHRERAAELAADPTQVNTMDDHTLLGALPSSRPWFDIFDTDSRDTVSFAQLRDSEPAPATDLTHVLDEVVDRVEAVGARAYLTDLTPPELAWRDLVCVRAFVTGFVPMTFGHRMRRWDGLPRMHSPDLPHGPAVPVDPRAAPPHPFP